MKLGEAKSLVLNVEISTSEAAEIERRAQDCGLPVESYVRDGAWASFCKARKELEAEREAEAESKRRVERARTHEMAELFVKRCKERPGGVGKGWRKGKTSPKRDAWGNVAKRAPEDRTAAARKV